MSEMTAKEFAKQFRRMCDSYDINGRNECYGCKLYAENICNLDELDNIVPIVEQWAAEHPEERSEKHEMTALEFLKEHSRMCQSITCNNCGICHDDTVARSCVALMGLNPDDTVAIVEQWAKAHPEKRHKTYMEDFFEKFPSCSKYPSGHPLGVCRKIVYGQDIEPICKGECAACWNAEMEGE